MPSFLSPVLPAVAGLALGSPSMPWTVYAANYVTGTAIPLDALTGATGPSTLNNGSNKQVWQWILTGSSNEYGLAINEPAPSTNTSPLSTLLAVATQNGSSINPFEAMANNTQLNGSGLRVLANGDIRAQGSARFIDAAGNIISGTPSDYRLKENIELLGSATERVCKLHPVTFNFKDETTERVGFIAHEVQEVLPSGATGEKDELTEDGKIKPQQLNLIDIVALLTKAVQELSEKVDELLGLR